MSEVDLRNYRQVIESLRGGAVEAVRPREAVQAVLRQEKPEPVFPIGDQRSAERFYSEAVVDRLLEQNYKQRQAMEAYQQTFQETDIEVSTLLFRLGIVFAIILILVVAVLAR